MALQEELVKQGGILFKYRGTLPLLILAAGIGVYIQSVYNTININGVYDSEIFKIICLSVSLLGLVIRIITVGYTPKNTSGRNTQGQLADELNTSGLYSMVRHPLYVGNFLMWLGIAILTQNLWFIIAFIFVYWVYYERIIFAEEQFLRKKFGKPYLDWASKTPAFVPNTGNFVKPSLTFSWRKVLRKEKNGIFAIFFVIFLFECIGDAIQTKTFILTYDFWFFAMLLSGIFYLMLKLLIKKTTWLDDPGR